MKEHKRYQTHLLATRKGEGCKGNSAVKERNIDFSAINTKLTVQKREEIRALWGSRALKEAEEKSAKKGKKKDTHFRFCSYFWDCGSKSSSFPHKNCILGLDWIPLKPHTAISQLRANVCVCVSLSLSLPPDHRAEQTRSEREKEMKNSVLEGREREGRNQPSSKFPGFIPRLH